MFIYQIYWFDQNKKKGMQAWRRSLVEVRKVKEQLERERITGVRFRKRYVPTDKVGLVSFLNENAKRISTGS